MEGAFQTLNVTIALVLMLGMVFLLFRLFTGPSLYDRALAVNSFGTKIVLFLCIFALIIGRADGIDIAILYALMNFIATIAILKFFRYRALSVSLDKMDITPMVTHTSPVKSRSGKPASAVKRKTPVKSKSRTRKN